MTRFVENPTRAAAYAFLLVATVFEFAVTEGAAIAAGSVSFTSEFVFGTIVSVLLVVVAVGGIWGERTPVHERWTPAAVALAVVWTAYLVAGVAFLLAGSTDWTVLVHTALAVGGVVVFAYLSWRE
ncbi:hypothetical protein [Haloarchaeobius sp. TZWSO28]|uniref:hypothetical protein n=1 Tax=Haloarchaeobius sp. TZWSO28 TaxID=3446119 RepID=UPI003EBA929E